MRVGEGKAALGSATRFLAPGEVVVDSTRCHLVVVDRAFARWLLTMALGLALISGGPRHHGLYLGQIGGAICVAGTMFLGTRVWRWRVTRYVFTNQRVLLLEGIGWRRINGLPLKNVTWTTYTRSIGGRLRGYGDLELNVTGQPSFRRLTNLPRPDEFYMFVLSLMVVGQKLKETTSPGSPSGGAPGPGGPGDDTNPIPVLRPGRWTSRLPKIAAGE